MQVVEATLVRRFVDQMCPNCGVSLMEMRDEIPLGKVYRVDLDSRSTVGFFNTEHSVRWQVEAVKDVDAVARGEAGWLPAEMLMHNGMKL